MQTIVISYLTGLEVSINFSIYLLYGYSTSIILTGVGLFGYIGIHSGDIAHLKTYVLLNMVVMFVRMIEFMTTVQQNYILLIANLYSLMLCVCINRYIKNVSQIAIGNPVQDEGSMHIQNEQVGLEYKIASIV